ncbi:hypothetical protein [Pedobacter sp. MC2016-24]|uniref:hypothetical protein n=1 Tax=Pedobacter sp. MC2016-24 TaxID=2780090 RepID=UPI001882B518|nr:hypothetical protein [Pedobacter sp. MC2016-24]MBE9598678.1 hypothetical protein [Pedobacter sp. MC2016-24]
MKDIKEIDIAELTAGFYILNLGSVLEITEEDSKYALVISRMNEKHVFRYPKDAKLWVISNAPNGN